ncbi:charged multivesicular body protein 6-A [Halyomorpha halys]|uniref:charged multivesicular body protein 6-A n=1 Tax=Halyomorpha halys TaxID=286706 RepID=UPI0006D512B2|nr:charged multivesicular body protein 6-A [Halyomorpha halys]
MGNLFGRKQKISRVTDHDKAVLQIKQQRDKLKQYQIRIESKLESDRILAKKLLSNGQKERAKLLLKKKRYQEQLLLQTDGQLENLEKMIQDLEYSKVEMRILEGLKVGNEALKKMNEAMNIDEIERIMEETAEGIEKQKEINELLNGKLTEEDEEAVDREYEELMRLEREHDEKQIILPEVPSEELEPEVEQKEKKKSEKEKAKKIALEA